MLVVVSGVMGCSTQRRLNQKPLFSFAVLSVLIAVNPGVLGICSEELAFKQLFFNAVQSFLSLSMFLSTILFFRCYFKTP